ncbi:MAG: hypothetical protein JAY90_06230 [Candidatus Thiodiazotropha lotti]|nr:hypothetical protein [Candidatus Thiodiazotropha lotti]
MRTSINRHPARRPNSHTQVARFIGLVGLLALSLLSSPLQAQHGFQFGAVYAKSLILSEQGNPIYVEYGLDGEIAGEIGEATGQYAEARVMAGEIYRAYQVQLEAVRAQFPDLDLVSKDTYESGNYTTLNGDTIQKPPLGGNTVMVALRPEAQRLLPDPSQLVLLELPINPQLQIGGDTKALLLDPDGAILSQSSLNIGFKTGFVSDAEGNERVTPDSLFIHRKHDDTIHGPLGNVVMENGLFNRGITEEDGKFTFRYPLPPCPGFYYDLQMPIYVELYYKRFNPRRSPRYPYFMRRLGFDYCVGYGQMPLGASLIAQMTQVSVIGIVAAMATPLKRPLDFVVDMTVLAGEARMPNTVGFGGETQYNGESAALERVAQDQYDFDGDDQPDRTELGRIVTEPDPVTGEPVERFEVQPASANPELQGVWLSSRHSLASVNPAETLPDLTRLSDWSADFNDRGLLSQINEEDLINTDLYVFRVSNGQLITERHGLKDSEVSKNFIGVDDEKGTFYYTIQVVGAREGRLNIHGYTSRWRSGPDGFQQWQAKGQMNPELYERKADHLRPGEPIQLIAINRATGYIGTLITEVQRAGTSNNPHEISFPIEDLMMEPPNLKIWAERTSKVEHGLTKGDEPEQAIGHEGAGLADDTEITIYTEWFDHDGKALPEEMDEHGYTGRLAKVVSPNQLAAVGGASESGNSLSEFEIKTGRQTQVIRLPENILGKQHLYVQVSGEPMSGNPDFGSSGLHEGKLQYRPDLYVPVKVPVFDEESTLLQLQAYRLAKRGFEEGTVSVEPDEPDPIYRYAYRPEFQFSVYDLAMQEVRRTDILNETENVLVVDESMITSTDQLVELLYDLTASVAGPLDAFSYEGNRELVFAVGEHEIRATLGEGQQLQFDNDSLEHLTFIDPIDYLTLRLYSNNDAENILWEWAFGGFTVFPIEETDVSADDHLAYIVALVDHPDESIVDWRIDSGNGSLSEQRSQTLENSAVVALSTSTQAGDTYRVEGILKSIPSISGTKTVNLSQKTEILHVVAGAPADITINKSKSEYRSDNTDTVTLTAHIVDQYGNPVQDGTPVTWLLQDSTSTFVSYDEITLAGYASAVLLAPIVPEDQIIIVQAGDIEQSDVMTVGRVTGTLIAASPSLNIDISETTSVTASVDAADGTPVFWQTSNGSIEGTPFVSGGTASAVLNSTGGYPGPVVVTATIGDRLLYWEGNFTTNPRFNAQVTHPVIVGGVETDGVETFTWPDGTVRNIRYWASTPVELTGPANTELFVTFSDQQIIEAFTFDDMSADTITGQVAGFSMAMTGAVVDSVGPHSGSGSVQFDGLGQGSIAHDTAFDVLDELAVSVWIRPDAANASLIVGKGTTWAMRLGADGRLQGSVTTTEGSFTVISDDVVPLDQWTHASLEYGQHGLRITLGSRDNLVTTQGQLITSADPILVGQGFSGHLDDLVFSERGGGSNFAYLEGVNAAGKMRLDASGRGTVYLRNKGSIPGGAIAAKVPITVRPVEPVVWQDGFSFFPRAYAAEDGVTTYAHVVERDWWFYTYDSVTSFFGADPESGVGTAANVAGGVLVVADIGSVVKNLWRATGFTEKEPNWTEFSLSLLGIATEFAVGAGEIVDIPVSGIRAVSARLGSSPFTDIIATRTKNAASNDLVMSEAEKSLITKLAQGDDALSQTFNAVVKSPEVYESAVRAADQLGDEFFDVVARIGADPNLGYDSAEAVIKALSGLKDEAFTGLRTSSVPLSESLTGLAQASKSLAQTSSKAGPELVTKILGNDNLYTAGYKQGELLRDMGELADVRGFDKLADVLRYGNTTSLRNYPQGLGFRYELEAAAFLKREGGTIVEVTRKIGGKKPSDATDIDIIADVGHGPVYIQVKRSADAYGYGKTGLKKTQTWIDKAQKDLGVPADDYSKIMYVNPDGVLPPPQVRKFFNRKGILPFEVPHR